MQKSQSRFSLANILFCYIMYFSQLCKELLTWKTSYSAFLGCILFPVMLLARIVRGSHVFLCIYCKRGIFMWGQFLCFSQHCIHSKKNSPTWKLHHDTGMKEYYSNSRNCNSVSHIRVGDTVAKFSPIENNHVYSIDSCHVTRQLIWS